MVRYHSYIVYRGVNLEFITVGTTTKLMCMSTQMLGTRGLLVWKKLLTVSIASLILCATLEETTPHLEGAQQF